MASNTSSSSQSIADDDVVITKFIAGSNDDDDDGVEVVKVVSSDEGMGKLRKELLSQLKRRRETESIPTIPTKKTK